jgi:hypothetical protein
MGLFGIGFAVGLSQDGARTVQHPVVIELQIVLPEPPPQPKSLRAVEAPLAPPENQL